MKQKNKQITITYFILCVAICCSYLYAPVGEMNQIMKEHMNLIYSSSNVIFSDGNQNFIEEVPAEMIEPVLRNSFMGEQQRLVFPSLFAALVKAAAISIIIYITFLFCQNHKRSLQLLLLMILHRKDGQKGNLVF